MRLRQAIALTGILQVEAHGVPSERYGPCRYSELLAGKAEAENETVAYYHSPLSTVTLVIIQVVRLETLYAAGYLPGDDNSSPAGNIVYVLVFKSSCGARDAQERVYTAPLA
ncbi:uncharacterized protein EDB91DRAFT_1106479 [Suillus paluster]|uniref:uncharacterized protein n=1 Tax=Suillus paluster TaxID=48578 RepID=UPI001B87C4B6|nr:uncharacterized protein EDB91DRAFT_1106479 [Suillus paluster]KAG1751638.1 hypothetical protein EDB91DRAFT_1106479 [Suillus paluster]